jgi:hypothetical protein
VADAAARTADFQRSELYRRKALARFASALTISIQHACVVTARQRTAIIRKLTNAKSIEMKGQLPTQQQPLPAIRLANGVPEPTNDPFEAQRCPEHMLAWVLEDVLRGRKSDVGASIEACGLVSAETKWQTDRSCLS